MARRSTSTLAAAILFFAASIGVFAWRLASADSEKTSDYETEWMCAACHARFSLNGAEAAAAAQESGGVPILCEKCREKQAYQVTICPVCETPFFGSEVPHSTGLCPKCNPDAKPAIAVFPMLSRDQASRASAEEEVPPDEPAEHPPNRN